ncbi:MAG: tail fiber domain-containing protein [Bdellovibrio sp.]
MKNIIGFFLIFVSIFASAAPLPAPGPLFTYEGILTDTSGVPINTSQSVTFQIFDSGTCLVYEETQTIIPNAQGEFSVRVGEGTRTDTTSNTIANFFALSGMVDCSGSVAQNVSGQATRSLRITVGTTTLNPDITVTNVPFAVNANKAESADKLGTNIASDFLLKAGVPTCNAGNFLTWNGSALACAAVSNVNGGTVTNVSGTAPVSVSNGTATPIVSLNNGSAAGEVYRWNGSSSWVSSKLKYTDLVNASSVNPWPTTTCASGEAVTFNSVNDGFACTSLAIATSQLNGTLSAAQMPAFNGDVSSTPGSLSLSLAASGVAAGTYKSVTVDAKGRVTAGTNPTTLDGYGILNAVKNLGGVGNMSANLDANKPASPSSGDLFVATDTQKIYRYDGTSWALMSSNNSGSSTVTSVTGTAPITISGTSSSPIISLANTNVTAGAYTKANITVDAQGRITGATSGSGTNLASEVTGILPIANGGTNSSAALSNNRIMASSGGAIVEAAAITANKALISDLNGIPTHSAVSSTELGYLSGVTSAIQTQLNGKASSSGWTNFSVIGVNNLGSLTAIPGSSSNTILQYSATGPVWSTASYPSSTTANQLLYSSSNNFIGGITTANNSVLLTNASGAPGWSSVLNDNFTQYALLSGRSGGQILYGGTAASNNLTLESTSNPTKGNVIINSSGGSVGIGTTSPLGTLSLKDSAHAPLFTLNTSDYDNGVTGSLLAIALSGNSGSVPASIQVSDTMGNGIPLSLQPQGGNVGIGTKNPASDLEILRDGTASKATFAIKNFFGSGTGGVTNPSIMLFNSRGSAAFPSNLGLGDNLASIDFFGQYNGFITKGASIVAGTASGWSSGYPTYMSFNTASGTPSTVFTERMRIHENGNVGINTNNPSYTLHVNGTVAGTSSYVQLSDVRLKRNIASVTNSLEKINSIRGVTYAWNKDAHPELLLSDREEMGVIAQEVEKVFPDAISVNSTTGIKSVAYNMLIAPLIEAVKEIRAWILSQDSAIAVLKKENAQLKQENVSIKNYLCSKDSSAPFCK